MALKPQDILVQLKVALHPKDRWSYGSLAASLGLSASEVHAAVQRCIQAGLMDSEHRRANRAALEELLVHGVKYVFAADRGRITRGIPTAHAAPPLAGELTSDDELPPVWPDPEGTVRGETLEPLYPSVPRAIRGDEKLYAGLALFDAIRVGRARERKLAAQRLHELLAS
jgi:DNA-binding MarR family transcriptional regulator